MTRNTWIDTGTVIIGVMSSISLHAFSVLGFTKDLGSIRVKALK